MNVRVGIKREERRLEKQLATLQDQLDRLRSAGKALGEFNGEGGYANQEACIVGCRESKDRESSKKALGQVQSTSEESTKDEVNAYPRVSGKISPIASLNNPLIGLSPPC
jgi:hypothetical protein